MPFGKLDALWPFCAAWLCATPCCFLHCDCSGRVGRRVASSLVVCEWNSWRDAGQRPKSSATGTRTAAWQAQPTVKQPRRPDEPQGQVPVRCSVFMDRAAALDRGAGRLRGVQGFRDRTPHWPDSVRIGLSRRSLGEGGCLAGLRSLRKRVG